MKNTKGILIGVFIVVALVIVGVVSFEALVGAPKAAEERNILKQYNFPGNAKTNSVPANGFPSAASKVKGVDQDLNGMLQDLDQTQDTATTSDIQDLQNDVNQL
jgi:hypothetical protein